MDKVILLPQHLTIVKILQKSDGQWIDGEWIEGEKAEINIQAGVFPLKPNDFKNYPEGLLKNDDRKLIAKEKINSNDEIFINEKKYIIVTSQEYGYLADINFYVIRESKEE